MNKPQRGPGRLGVIQRVLGLRGFSSMRLPQKLLLWGQVSDMLQVPLLRVGPCKQHFYEPKPVVGSVTVCHCSGAREMSSQ